MTDDPDRADAVPPRRTRRSAPSRDLPATELLGADADHPASQIAIAQLVAEATRGPYPPPSMLREYKELDPEFYRELTTAPRQQREHRQRLEILATEGDQRRQDRAQTYSFLLSAGGLVLPLSAYVVAAYFGVQISIWVVLAIAALGIGQRPVAAALALWLSRGFGAPPPSKGTDSEA